MALLKDIYDIIATQPKAKKQIEGAVEKILRGAFFKFFRSEPTLQERKDKLKPLITQFTEDDFSSKFEKPLAFLGVLLGMIVESVYTARHGCLVEKLFLPGYHFYFPAPAEQPSLKRKETTTEVHWELDNKDKSRYVFYAFKKSNEGQAEVSKARAKLDQIPKTNPIEGEAKTFTDWLTQEGYTVKRLIGISELNETGALLYLPQYVQFENLPLNFTDTTTKASVAEELRAVLNFTLI